MVSRDFSHGGEEQFPVPSVRIAPVFDRLLAFFIDFLVFSPVISLAGAFTLRDFRALALEESGSTAMNLIWFSLVGGSLALCILIEALCVYRYKGTPGQLFMQLEVRPFPSREKLGLLQCLTRATLWWVSVPLLLPLLGIYTNRYRRAFHDRASETMVATRKAVGDPGPQDLEMRFFQSWSQMFVLFVVFVAAGTFAEVHRMVRSGAFSVAAEEPRAVCESIDRSVAGLARLDRAVAGFLAGAWDKDCLELEADLALWDGASEERPLANVAMGLALEDGEQGKEYFAQACHADEKGEACGIARFMTSKAPDRGDLLRRSGLASVTGRLLLVRETVDRGEIPSAAALIKDLRGEEMLTSWLERQEVRAFWKLKDQVGRRSPASDEARALLKDFETRYDLK